MDIERAIAKAPRATSVAQQVAHLEGPCIGCAVCRGLCQPLIDALTVPDAIRARNRASAAA